MPLSFVVGKDGVDFVAPKRRLVPLVPDADRENLGQRQSTYRLRLNSFLPMPCASLHLPRARLRLFHSDLVHVRQRPSA
jgi:hypothetical protein